ncbi:MAG: FHA domain-containing protein [Saprospiraceae bacterium]|nr:FHA domain-containing protein [Saprospiraceae bacterium]
MSKIKVGHVSNPANHVRINDNSVSREHLEVEKIDTATLRIIDLGSLNGTWIDGLEIVESTLKKNQTIRIGHQNYTGDDFFQKVNKYFLDKRVHWMQEFSALETEFKKYEKKKSRISQSLQNKMNILRGSLSIGIALFFFMYGEGLGIPPELRFITSIGGGILAGSIVPYMVAKEKVIDYTLELNKEYSKVLACPRCGRDLSKMTYKHWKGEKRCIACDAIWVE